ncbi:MAG: hypothetical protein M1821_001409 [Bathelium mastoideum]|nr:MAG: hypothetical protein M1821_001409 [Bathelium mastoideum]
MPPKSAPNPTPKTESAREALKSFFCTPVYCSSMGTAPLTFHLNQASSAKKATVASMNSKPTRVPTITNIRRYTILLFLLSTSTHTLLNLSLLFLQQRLKEMKQMHREPLASKARRAERKADARAGLVSIKMDLNPSNTTGGASSSGGGGGGGGGFKKGGFKNAFVGTEAGTMSDDGGLMDAGKAPREADVVPSVEKEVNEREEEDEESDLEGGEDAYDPRRPTGCHPGCPGWDF